MGVFPLRILIYIIDLVTPERFRLAVDLPYLCLTLEAVSLFQVSSCAIMLLCLDAPQSIVQYSA